MTTSKFQVEKELGENLNNFSGISVIEAQDAVELASLISKIKFPISIVSIVVKGNRFYAFVNSQRPIKRRKIEQV